MTSRFVKAFLVCLGLLSQLSCHRADAGVESRWFRWRAGGGVVQHIVTNDSAEAQVFNLSQMFIGGPCGTDNFHLPYIAPFDLRLSHQASIELKPHTWFAVLTQITEHELGCKADLWRVMSVDDSKKLTSTGLTSRPERLDFLPFEPGELQIDASVLRDDLIDKFEPKGMTLQIQVRVRNLSREMRLIAITGRHLDCDPNRAYDWVVGPGEAPVQLASGPAGIKPNAAVVFSQRLRGSGEFAACTASFKISDGRRPRESKLQFEEQSNWVEVKELVVPLNSAQVVVYR
jgi:hypothetical protein